MEWWWPKPDWSGCKREGKVGKETLEDDAQVHYLDSGNGLTVHTLIKLYTLNFCTLGYFSYTLIKLKKRDSGRKEMNKCLLRRLAARGSEK